MSGYVALAADPPDDPASLDVELLTLVRGGDAAAFARLVSRYWNPLVGYLARIVPTVDAAEDIAQEAFVRLWERRQGWRPGSHPRLLIYRIARNLAIDDGRIRRIRSRLLANRPPSRQVEEPAGLTVIEYGELKVAVEGAIASLSPRRREVLVLSRFHALSRQEIAELTGLSGQTVANHLSAALAELRRLLRAYLPPGPRG
jgi:RNA polymerase sigma-70 factor (ECF subfamily)